MTRAQFLVGECFLFLTAWSNQKPLQNSLLVFYQRIILALIFFISHTTLLQFNSQVFPSLSMYDSWSNDLLIFHASLGYLISFSSLEHHSGLQQNLKYLVAEAINGISRSGTVNFCTVSVWKSAREMENWTFLWELSKGKPLDFFFNYPSIHK